MMRITDDRHRTPSPLTRLLSKAGLLIVGGLVGGFIAGLIGGCQNVDPYYGHVDSDRTLKKSGLIYSTYSTASVGWGHKQKKTAYTAALQARENRQCLQDDNVDWHYLSEIEDTLRRQFNAYSIDVFRYGPRVYIRLPGEEAYLVNSPHFNPQFYPIIHRLIEKLNHYNRTRLDLIGHADATGSTDYNQRLSELRAYNLERYLNKFGISPTRTTSLGRGELEPLVSNDTPEGQAINRRVSIIICEVAEHDLPEKAKQTRLF